MYCSLSIWKRTDGESLSFDSKIAVLMSRDTTGMHGAKRLQEDAETAL
jgi:hypothetical protein